jgi:hypothetical protein
VGKRTAIVPLASGKLWTPKQIAASRATIKALCALSKRKCRINIAPSTLNFANARCAIDACSFGEPAAK